MLHVVPSPVRCLIWNECSWPGCWQSLEPLPIFLPIPLLQLPLPSLHVFVSRLVRRFVSSFAADLHQLLPPSEMADYLLHSIAPSELAAYLMHLPAPSELVACWKRLSVLLEPGAPLDEAIGRALLWPRRGGSRLCL